MSLVERGMQWTKGHELNGDKASDDDHSKNRSCGRRHKMDSNRLRIKIRMRYSKAILMFM